MSEQAEPNRLAEFGKPIRWIGNGICALGALIAAGGTAAIVASGEFEVGFYIGGAIFLAIGLGMRWAATRMENGDGPEMPVVVGYVFMGLGAIAVVGGIVVTFDEPGGIALIVFGLVFIGAGYLAKRLFATPEGMKKVAIGGYQAAIRTGDGRVGRRRSTSYINVPEDASEAEVEAAKAAAVESRVQRRDDWASGRIEPEEKRTGHMFFIIAVAWTLFAGALAGAAWLWDEFIYLFAGFMGLGALAMWLAAVRNYLRNRKYAASHFELEQNPPRLGATLTGTVASGVSKSSPPADGFHLTLRCVHHYQTTRGTGSDSRTVTHSDVLWQTKHDETGHAGARHRGLTVPVALDIPADQPAATLSSGDGIRWELEVRAAMPGLDYKATFVLPVQAAEG